MHGKVAYWTHDPGFESRQEQQTSSLKGQLGHEGHTGSY